MLPSSGFLNHKKELAKQDTKRFIYFARQVNSWTWCLKILFWNNLEIDLWEITPKEKGQINVNAVTEKTEERDNKSRLCEIYYVYNIDKAFTLFWFNQGIAHTS